MRLSGLRHGRRPSGRSSACTPVDFNRLRRAGKDEAIPLAAGIFLDALNVFLLFLRRFARSS